MPSRSHSSCCRRLHRALRRTGDRSLLSTFHELHAVPQSLSQDSDPFRNGNGRPRDPRDAAGSGLPSAETLQHCEFAGCAAKLLSSELLAMPKASESRAAEEKNGFETLSTLRITAFSMTLTTCRRMLSSTSCRHGANGVHNSRLHLKPAK